MSDGAFPQRFAVKLAPSMPGRRLGLHHPSPASTTAHSTGSVSRPARVSTGRCSRGHTSLPQGSLAPVRVLLSRSISAYYDPIRQSRRHATISRLCRLYVAPSLCGSAKATHETFPTFATALSTRTVDPTPVVRCSLPLCSRQRCQASPSGYGVATTLARLCQQYPAGIGFRRCIVRFMLRPARLPCPPDWLRPNEVICSSLRPLGALSSPLLPIFVAEDRWGSG